MLTLSHATERDVDLLLVEELKCSVEFVRWLAARALGSIGFAQCEVLHSQRRIQTRREIDISVQLKSPGAKSAYLFIENKLDTAQQFRQAESYRAEAELLLASGECSAAATVLVCPQSYAGEASEFAAKFDHVLFYEEVGSFLLERAEQIGGELGARLVHRHDLLRQAIDKARRGYRAVPIVAVEEFNSKYVELCSQNFPDLRPGASMTDKGRPGGSRTMIFHRDALPAWPFLPQMRIVHQLVEGNANVNFYTWGDHFTKLAGAMGRDLAGTTYRIAPSANKRVNGRAGLMIIAETPKIDNLKDFDHQRDAILEGMRATEALRQWFVSNKEAIAGWASLLAG